MCSAPTGMSNPRGGLANVTSGASNNAAPPRRSEALAAELEGVVTRLFRIETRLGEMHKRIAGAPDYNRSDPPTAPGLHGVIEVTGANLLPPAAATPGPHGVFEVMGDYLKNARQRLDGLEALLETLEKQL